MATRSLVSAWRDAVRDSPLNSTAKLVCMVLSTFMDRHGVAWPGRKTLAQGCSLTDRAIDAALSRVEGAGYLDVTRPDRNGRSRTNRYRALVPETANVVRLSDWKKAKLAQEKANLMHGKGERGSPESSRSESKEKAGSSNDERQRRPVTDCMECGKVDAVSELGDKLVCDECMKADWWAA